MMELYKIEKINSLAGCWSVVLQILVFFLFYKVFYIIIEMWYVLFFN